MPTIDGFKSFARNTIQNDGRVDSHEAQALIAKASQADGTDVAALKAELKAFFQENQAKFDPEAKAKMAAFLGVSASSSPVVGGGSSPANVGTGIGSAMDIRLGRVSAPGTEVAGKLGPTNNSLPLTERMAAVTKSADEGLNLEVVNRDFNPFKQTVGEFKRPGEVFQGKTLIPVRDLIGGALQGEIKAQLAQAGVPAEQMEAALAAKMAELTPMLSKISEGAELRNSSQQFNVDGKADNRVVFYGGDIHHANIDTVIDEMGKQGMRGLKIMSHINSNGQGGKVSDILQDGVMGVTHTGGFSSGVMGGKPLSIKSDWPSDYGKMSDSNKHYNAILAAVDYQAGSKKEIPQAFVMQYKHNADMWDVAAGMTVPFASNDPDTRHTSYKFNPLDVHNHESAKSVGASLAKIDWEAMKADGHGAFYCAEGQYCVASLGPKDDLLIKQSKYGDTSLGKLIDSYQAAVVELEGNPTHAWELLQKGKLISDEEFEANKTNPISCKDWPQAAWLSLAEKGKENGGITEQQYTHLANTDRNATYLEWVPEETKGWESFEPYQKDGLIATPMTVATMGWGLIRSTMPRQEVAKTVANDVVSAYKSGDDVAKKQIEGLLGGNAPNTPQGQAALQQLGMKAATGLLLNAVGSPEFKQNMLEKAGFKEIIIANETPEQKAEREEIEFNGTPEQRAELEKKEIESGSDRGQFLAVFNKFMAALKDPALMADQAAMDKAMLKLDGEFRELTVKRSAWDPVAKNHSAVVEGPMLYAAPNSMLLFARNPELYDSQAIRYVANLQHAEQAVAVTVTE